jgi:hypothetical protein
VDYGVAPAFDPDSGDLYLARRYNGLKRYAKLSTGVWDTAAVSVLAYAGSNMRYAPAFYDNTTLAVGTSSDSGDGGRIIMLVRDDATAAWEVVPAEGNVWSGVQMAAYASTIGNNTMAFPAFLDVDGDGTKELVVGGSNGKVRVWMGNALAPEQSWTELAPGELAKTGLDAVAPATEQGMALLSVADLDRDGKAELVVGTRAGGGLRLFVYNAAGEWVARTGAANPLTAINSKYLFSAASAFYDVDGDGYDDVVVGEYYGSMFVFLSYPTTQSAVWTRRGGTANPFGALSALPSANSHPAFADLNGDGTQDLVVAGEGGTMRAYWRLEATAEGKKMGGLGYEWRRASEFASTANVDSLLVINATLRSSARAVDDALASVEAALAVAIPTVGDRVFMSVAFGDLDGDGDLDLVVGFLKDRLFFENLGTVTAPAWTQMSAGDPRIADVRTKAVTSHYSTKSVMFAPDGALFVRPGVGTSAPIVAHRFVRESAGNWVEDPRGNITYDNAGTHVDRYRMNMYFAATTLATSSYTGDAIVLFPRNGAVRTYAYEGGVSRWLDESPVPTDVNAYYPAGAFYDSTTLAIGGGSGELHLFRPNSLCLLPVDTVGGGGGCSRAFAGSCPDPYMASDICTCAPGYVGGLCDDCDQGFGRDDRGLCVACNSSQYGDRAISKTCDSCEVAKIPTTERDACRLCDNGAIPNAQQSLCTTCDAGKHVSASGTGCEVCRPNEVRFCFILTTRRTALSY